MYGDISIYYVYLYLTTAKNCVHVLILNCYSNRQGDMSVKYKMTNLNNVYSLFGCALIYSYAYLYLTTVEKFVFMFIIKCYFIRPDYEI